MNNKIYNIQTKSQTVFSRPAVLSPVEFHQHLHQHTHKHPYGFSEKISRLWVEMKKNWRVEAMCITACETGELSTQATFYYAGLAHYNEFGLVAGIISGFSFAFFTAARHSQGVTKNNIGHILKQTLTAEWACVLSATTVQYFMGKYGSTFNPNPLEGFNLLLRLIGLPIAFGIGTLAMSLLTLKNPHLSCACHNKEI